MKASIYNNQASISYFTKFMNLTTICSFLSYVTYVTVICEWVTLQMKTIHQTIICVSHVLMGQYLGNTKTLILTHLSRASLLWDIGKQHSPRCDAAESGVPSGAILFALRNFTEELNKN